MSTESKQYRFGNQHKKFGERCAWFGEKFGENHKKFGEKFGEDP